MVMVTDRVNVCCVATGDRLHRYRHHILRRLGSALGLASWFHI